MARDNTGCRVQTSRGRQSVRAAEWRMRGGRQSVRAAESRRVEGANQSAAGQLVVSGLWEQLISLSHNRGSKSLELGKEALEPPPAGYCYFYWKVPSFRRQCYTVS